MRNFISLYFSIFLMMNANATSRPLPQQAQFNNLYIGPAGELVVRAGLGVFRSTDDGYRWTKVLEDAGIVLIAQGSDLLSVKIQGKIFRSKDYGVTWIYDGITADVPWAEEMFFKSIDKTSVDEDGTYYICVKYKSLQISGDGGKSWREANPLNGCRGVAANRDVIYVLGVDGLYKSKDRGVHWLVVPQGAHASQSPISNGAARYLKTDRNGTLYGGGYESRDEGVTWQRQNFGFPQEWAPRVDEVKRDVLYITVGGTDAEPWLSAYRSVDGKTATKINFKYPWNDIQAGEDGALYIVTDDLIYKSTDDGKTWQPLGRNGITW